ncbi:MAG: pyridoxal phosphate-dependent aminotransferase [Desulfovibrionaceae bacterium]|nr:pyridoxal phosphate-dependent aminotransferase [Desulfovibrionaceae bacterium]MBF0513242.1 pyridoxal phosphate-dependent aminotransferase [Desulfovibrionaceae bacterium]
MNKACAAITSFLVMDILERAHALEAQGRRVIHLEIGEPDFAPPPPVSEAAARAIRDGETHYTHSLGLPELRAAICADYLEKYGVTVCPDQIVVTSGTSPAMLLAFSVLLGQGDAACLTDPHYACYPNFLRLLGAIPRTIPTREENGFHFTPELLAARLVQDGVRASAVVVNSPSNPAGALMDEADFAAVCRLGPVVISDEIYHGLVYRGRARSALEFTDNCFVLNGFSKLYAMTGWRLGYVIAPPRYVAALQRLQQNLFICAGSVAQWAGLAALTEPSVKDYVAAMVATYDERRTYLVAQLRKLGLGTRAEPTGAFYVLANVKHLGRDSLSLAYDILDKACLGVTPGIDFGQGAEGYLRFSYANSLENIEEGMERLKKYLENFSKE